ncbi:peptidylprolyl isomerase [Mucilaginibacter pallidiroseus]|uniref:Peptidyl-prolyl cis-trans isomerase n=1 Tax=Mucilaginibacter pallidiroseus TaxID=2599295 RepID=A0A563U7W5_9SPHI|nr:FKBP-type peptidyl-prolyl cis-trans isomerase [Mucilaginibacter pallidiroseus]TWR27389.1 peptidylprolyl isomerase [Mucilaginibacter pallidiroseus]
MKRVLYILLMLVAGLTACKKGYDAADEAMAQAEADDKIVQDYLAANPDVKAVRLDSANVQTGIYYVVVAPGSGNSLFTSSTSVTVDYVGRKLLTGEVFSQSNNFHPSFRLGEVIRAWKLALPKINKGGRIRIIAPSRYAYGAYDQPSIGLPANSIVDFDIQLLDVTN